MLEIDKIYVLDENIVLKSINDKFWALDTRLGAQYKLNRVGFDILSSLDGMCTLHQIVEKVATKYNVSEDIVQSDMIDMLKIAIKKNVILRR